MYTLLLRQLQTGTKKSPILFITLSLLGCALSWPTWSQLSGGSGAAYLGKMNLEIEVTLGSMIAFFCVSHALWNSLAGVFLEFYEPWCSYLDFLKYSPCFLSIHCIIVGLRGHNQDRIFETLCTAIGVNDLQSIKQDGHSQRGPN